MANKKHYDASVDLEAVLGDILDEYRDQVAEAVQDAIPDVADDTVRELESTSPKRTGEYARSWDTWKEEKSRFLTKYRVYNHKYRLTHLLEYSHALRNGGRSTPQPHIQPAEEHAVERLEKVITEAIENAG